MRDLKDVLGKLGEMSPGHIALHFAEHGIKGTPRCPGQCAVAEYVKKECSAGWVSVGVEINTLPEDVELGCDVGVNRFDTVKTPESVWEFIRLFDDHHFPSLEKKGGR